MLEREAGFFMVYNHTYRSNVGNFNKRKLYAKVVDQLQNVPNNQQFSGLLPHPKILQEYEQVYPGAANRIIKMAEDQSQHRQKIEWTAMFLDFILKIIDRVLLFVEKIILSQGRLFSLIFQVNIYVKKASHFLSLRDRLRRPWQSH